MNPSEITAVLVTKGERDITEVLASLNAVGFQSVHVWDNSKIGERRHLDLSVYGRYFGALIWMDSHCAFVDDDTIVDWPALIATAQPGRSVCNMPPRFRPGYEGTGISLVGFGCIFPRSLIYRGFDKYDAAGFPRDEVFLRECDRVWTHGNRDLIDWADVHIRQLPCSWKGMYTEARTNADYTEIRRRLALLP